ncbi:MAG: hypothetical protein IPN22_14055 [Bacteroidetes bacterium]|nr:hypothetical protein [Bacteroidota bacterium]
MKYFLLLLCCVFIQESFSQDTLFLATTKDPRYTRYLDSLQAYEIGYSVAKNICNKLKEINPEQSLDNYFLSKYEGRTDTSKGYFYTYNQNVAVEPGHMNIEYRYMKSDSTFPWEYLESQYKRLNAIKIKPTGVMQGGELPDVYIYAKPSTVVAFKVLKRFVVVGQTIKFSVSNDGKTKTPYIEKVYYIQDAQNRPVIDSIEKLDPVTKKHVD